MIVVDTFIVHSKATGSEQSQRSFYQDLATGLIDNNYDNNYDNYYDRSARRTSGEGVAAQDPTRSTRTGGVRSGVCAHLTPTKKRRTSKGVISTHREQGNCRICKSRTTHICSVCEDDAAKGPEPWLCDTKKGKLCFSQHMESFHPYDYDKSR
jgi:hypothetical protein